MCGFINLKIEPVMPWETQGLRGRKSSVRGLCFIGGPERGSGYADSDTMVLEAIQKSIHEGFAFEQIVPLRVIKVGSDDGRLSAVPLVHQLEEGIDLFGIESEVSEFIDEEDIVLGEPLKEFGSASVRKGSVQFVQEILCLVESSAAARNQRLSQQTDCEPRLARPRISDKNNVLGPIHERERC